MTERPSDSEPSAETPPQDRRRTPGNIEDRLELREGPRSRRVVFRKDDVAFVPVPTTPRLGPAQQAMKPPNPHAETEQLLRAILTELQAIRGILAANFNRD